MGVHEGHRERMKKRFLEHGLESFDDHNVLELILFYALPRSDVNPLAHALLDRFGSLAAVFDAPCDELTKVPGIGENAALLIKLIPQAGRRCQLSRARTDDILDSTKKAGAYLLPLFYAERDEVVYMICLDARGKVLNCRQLVRGSVNSAAVSVRKIVENALSFNSTSVILAHNHTSGVATPSQEDRDTTRRVEAALQAVDINLTDHIIVADDTYVSLADEGFFE